MAKLKIEAFLLPSTSLFKLRRQLTCAARHTNRHIHQTHRDTPQQTRLTEGPHIKKKALWHLSKSQWHVLGWVQQQVQYLFECEIAYFMYLLKQRVNRIWKGREVLFVLLSQSLELHMFWSMTSCSVPLCYILVILLYRRTQKDDNHRKYIISFPQLRPDAILLRNQSPFMIAVDILNYHEYSYEFYTVRSTISLWHPCQMWLNLYRAAVLYGLMLGSVWL